MTAYPKLNIDIDWKRTTSYRVYTVRNVERRADRIIITGEADAGHDRAGIKGSTLTPDRAGCLSSAPA